MLSCWKENYMSSCCKLFSQLSLAHHVTLRFTVADLDHTADVQWVYLVILVKYLSNLMVICCAVVITFLFSALSQEFTPGESPWRKPSSSVPWACSATWRTQRQWNHLILLTWNQRVRAQISLFYTCMSPAVSRSLKPNSVHTVFFNLSLQVMTWSLSFSTS